MSDHVDLEIADFLAERLPAARRFEFVRHVEGCSECARRVEWARQLQEDARRDDAPHLSAARVVEISRSGPESATAQETDHLTWCSGCRQDLEWAESTPTEDADARRRRTRRWFGGLGIAATLAAAALVILLLAPPGGNISELARIEPLPVRITRAPTEPSAFDESRFRGLESYRDGDYTGARVSFTRASELEPGNAEARLYLGSTLLMLGEHDAAVEELAHAVEDAEGVLVLQESLWQLAQASLAAGDREGAATALARLAEAGGTRGADAAEQLRLLGSR